MATVTVADFDRRFREEVLSMLFYSRRTHTHLDWYKAGSWLEMDDNIIQLAFDDEVVIGVLGLSPALNGATWLRMAAVAQGYDPALILGILWEQLCSRLMAEGVTIVTTLVIAPWLAIYLPAMGFHFVEDVVTMYRSPAELPPLKPHQITIRSGYLEDLREISAIDHRAFPPPWQMSVTDIRLSQRQAASCTIAEMDGVIVGYELSTRHHTSGHLARLAVDPAMQGHGIGAILLDTLLTRFSKRGVLTMTVNTQETNIVSQRLYQRYSFRRNGFDLPVWQWQV